MLHKTIREAGLLREFDVFRAVAQGLGARAFCLREQRLFRASERCVADETDSALVDARQQPDAHGVGDAQRVAESASQQQRAQ